VRRLLTILITLSLMVAAAPAEAEVTQQQLTDARAEANARAAELSAQLEELDQILSQQAAYEAQIAGLQERITDRQREIALSALAAKEQARAMYVSAGSTAVQAAATPEGITRLGTKNAYLQVVVDTAGGQPTHLPQEDAAALQDRFGRSSRSRRTWPIRRRHW
jgi:predicted  nucleic acid-binding Zn-ribbon protein